MKIYQLASLILLVIGTGCSDESGSLVNPTSADWLVPESEVFDGGPGKDGIPAIEDPKFTTASAVDYLDNNDLILGIRIGDRIRAYPHPILDWHEIVNDEFEGAKYSLTYCPLTGTGIGWNRVLDNNETTFGVSGLLYNTNLMPYDRNSNSTWSQQRLECVNGDLIGRQAELYSFVETTWGTWKAAYPDSEVLNTDTGFSRNYRRYPYGDYRTNDASILFPISNEDDRLNAKDRVLGVKVDRQFKAYPFDVGQNEITISEDRFNGQNLVIIRDVSRNFNIAFEDDSDTSFEVLDASALPYIIKNVNGVKYDLLGFGDDGSRLTLADQFMGYWFSWATFYPDLDIFE